VGGTKSETFKGYKYGEGKKFTHSRVSMTTDGNVWRSVKPKRQLRTTLVERKKPLRNLFLIKSNSFAVQKVTQIPQSAERYKIPRGTMPSRKGRPIESVIPAQLVVLYNSSLQKNLLMYSLSKLTLLSRIEVEYQS
jgi:hypothetical protein